MLLYILRDFAAVYHLVLSTMTLPSFFPQQKRFIKGLRQYGKNFFRIRKDFLPSKKTVIEHYVSAYRTIRYACSDFIVAISFFKKHNLDCS